jgi:hypothetical protein
MDKSPTGRIPCGADRQHERLIALRSQDVLEKAYHEPRLWTAPRTERSLAPGMGTFSRPKRLSHVADAGSLSVDSQLPSRAHFLEAGWR